MQTNVFTRNPVLRGYWYAVARSSDVMPGPLAVTVLGEPIVLWRPEGCAITAARDRCPHREAPLSLGRVIDDCLQCAYHGWTFGTSGACVRIPSLLPERSVPPTAHLTTVHVTELYGLVWVSLDAPVADIPVMAYDSDARFRRINTPVEVWRASATRMTDNFMDISHVPWVHTGTFGRAQNTYVPPITLAQLDDDFYGYRYEIEANNRNAATVTSGSHAPVIARWMTTGFSLPFTTRSTIRYATGLEHILLLLTTPIDDVTSYFTFVVWRNDDFSVSADEVVAFDRRIGMEDKAMLERIPGVLSLEVAAAVSVQADRPSLAWRRQFVALLQGAAQRESCKGGKPHVHGPSTQTYRANQPL
jgi:phenylpropionate dioxygenase-like ring-hydroxylating dioxygenase large terminal subunit